MCKGCFAVYEGLVERSSVGVSYVSDTSLCLSTLEGHPSLSLYNFVGLEI